MKKPNRHDPIGLFVDMIRGEPVSWIRMPSERMPSFELLRTVHSLLLEFLKLIQNF